jgi:hypothetical protein
MSGGHLRLRIALCSGLLVLLVGSAYILLRDQRWQSTAALALTPQAVTSADRAALFDSFDRSGTMGTYVEVISSPDTLKRAGSPPVSVEARAVPDTRVIDVTATGGQNGVRPALINLISASMSIAPGLGDVWQLNTIEQPSQPTKAGPSNLLLSLAVLLLAALATVASLVLMRELGIPRQAGKSESPDGAPRRRVREQIGVGSETGFGSAKR